ncbi:DUF4209 domain-containing protein [Sulfurimonas microaerophilic]|uniref:DUF4209 domain-containing protein n=1 Tax=Sulfurimonas microaerophilic TaxID=3058392 RepID=UPI0027153986|nr:DUF4209 domain-containing protein [Sulfurimonas sp. hsl 1-7]
MESINKKLNEFNASFQLQVYQRERMNVGEPDKVEGLTSLQKYELALNQDFLYIKDYRELKDSFLPWIDPEAFNISGEELVSYFKDRLTTQCSIDRIYLFNELILNFCEQKEKRSAAQGTLESSRKVLESKIANDDQLDLLLKLFARYIAISEKYKLNDEEFVQSFAGNLFSSINIEEHFYYTLNFFKHIFNSYKNKMFCYQQLVDVLNEFSSSSDKQLLSKSRDLQTTHAARLAQVYEKINDHKLKNYFYQKEIDNTLERCQEITNSNAMINQSVVMENIEYARKAESYKLKELKVLFKKFADYIAEHYDEFFQTISYDDMNKDLREFYEGAEEELMQESSVEEKLDYLLFYLFHTTYYSPQYEKHKKEEQQNGCSISDLFTPNRIDLKGYSYAPKDQALFSYFNMFDSLYNDLFLYLDYKFNWIVESAALLKEDVKNLENINDFKMQFTRAIESFCDQKYMEFMYISPTLIEVLLKQYLYQINGDILGGRTELVEKTLNQIIDELIDDENCYIDKNILRYISYIMVENAGMNMRNNILHGNYKDGYFHKKQAMYLYTILIYLIRYFANDQD